MQAASVRREHAAILDDEDIEARPLRHEPFSVAQYGRVETVVMSLQQAGGQIAPLVILDRRIEASIRDARHAGDPQMGAARLHLGRDHVDPGKRVGDEMVVAIGRAARACDPRPAA